MADVPAQEVGRPVSAHATGRPAFRWAGAGDSRTGVVSPDELHPGDMVIVPAEYGGCDQFGWAPDSDSAVEDVANEAASPFWGRRCAVRIAPGLLLDDLWNRISGVLQDDAARPAELVDRLLDALPTSEVLEEALKKEEEEHSPSTVRAVQGARKGLKKLRRPKRGRLELRVPYRGGREKGAVFVAEQGVKDAGRSDDARSATEDDSISPTFGKPVALDDHGARVERLAGQFAETLRLGEAADLRLAAYLHDAGKADPRFQTMLSGGDPWNRPEGSPLAKSGARKLVADRRQARWAATGLAARGALREDGASTPALCERARSRLGAVADRNPSRAGPAVLRLSRSGAGPTSARVSRRRKLASPGGRTGAAVVGIRFPRRRLAVLVRGLEAALRDLETCPSRGSPASRRPPGVRRGAPVTVGGTHRLDGLEPDNLLALHGPAGSAADP